jgi:hypothetical protein
MGVTVGTSGWAFRLKAEATRSARDPAAEGGNHLSAQDPALKAEATCPRKTLR